MQKRQIVGFTLIEMLISLVIFSSAVGLATQAYRQFVVDSSRFMDKYRNRLQQGQVRQLVIERVLDSVLYYSTKHADFSSNQAIPLWIGDTHKLTAVTSHSLQDPNRAALYQLRVQNGGFYYCEKVIELTLPSANIVPADICDFSLKVEDQVKNIQIRYYGWASALEMIIAISGDPSLGQPQGRKWSSVYMGDIAQLMPEWVEITLVYSAHLSSENQLSSGNERSSGKKPNSLWRIPVKYQEPERMSSSHDIMKGN